MEPIVSIVIVNYNTKEYTAQCIDSIYAAPPLTSFEIVLVDNASRDDSADWLAARYPQINLIRSPRNGGIAGGNNLGIRASRSRYVLLLNNDTVVIANVLDRAVAFLDRHPKTAGVGGRLLNPDGSFQSGFSSFPSLWEQVLVVTKLGSLFRPYYPSHPPCNQAREVDWMSTAYMLFRRDALEQVDHVDEEFFIYCDETDLQYRLKKAGWKIHYLPDVETIHFGGKSLNPWSRRKLVYRGYLLFFKKHYPAWQSVFLRSLYTLVSLVKWIFWLGNMAVPSRRTLAKNELKSNQDILSMCLARDIPKAN